jgi:hypothetical protein
MYNPTTFPVTQMCVFNQCTYFNVYEIYMIRFSYDIKTKLGAPFQ